MSKAPIDVGRDLSSSLKGGGESICFFFVGKNIASNCMRVANRGDHGRRYLPVRTTDQKAQNERYFVMIASLTVADA